MVSEEKVILMTKLAAYEKREGRRNLNIVNYYRSDYIGFQLLKAIVAATISYFAVLAVYIFYNFEDLMAEIYRMDLYEFGRKLVIIYACTVGGYTLFAYIVNSLKYSGAKKKLKGYYINLRKLENLNKNQ
ncbi:MAG: hypothetical protein K6F53_00050 [Lachnospiraceae bacterium]|nr:hypothetical protein [Lachnospiraceae bacterium]